MKLKDLKPKEKFEISLDNRTYEVLAQNGPEATVKITGTSLRTKFPSNWEVTQVDAVVEFTRQERNQFAKTQIRNQLELLKDLATNGNVPVLDIQNAIDSL